MFYKVVIKLKIVNWIRYDNNKKLHPRRRHPARLKWPFQEQRGSASAPVSDFSAPACTNGVWPPLWAVSVAQKNKPSTMLSSNVQSIDSPWTARPVSSWRWDNWMAAQHLHWDLARPSNGLKELAQKKKSRTTHWNTWSSVLSDRLLFRFAQLRGLSSIKSEFFSIVDVESLLEDTQLGLPFSVNI